MSLGIALKRLTIWQFAERKALPLTDVDKPNLNRLLKSEYDFCCWTVAELLLTLAVNFTEP